MTGEEAIERYKNNAEYERTHGNLQGCLEFRQLAEWLESIDKIRAEINRKIQEENYGVISDHTHEDGLEEALEIINKHIGDTE